MTITYSETEEIVCSIYRPSTHNGRTEGQMIITHVGKKLTFETFAGTPELAATQSGYKTACKGNFEKRFDQAMCRYSFPHHETRNP